MTESELLLEQIRPILANRHPDVVAKTLGGLVAWLLAGCAPARREEMRK